jgi:hypothetical protein
LPAPPSPRRQAMKQSNSSSASELDASLVLGGSDEVDCEVSDAR